MDLEKRYEHASIGSAQEEKKILADIKKMKDAIPNAERLLKIKPSRDALYEQKKSINEQINILQAEIEVKQKEVETVRKDLDEAKEQRDDIKQ